MPRRDSTVSSSLRALARAVLPLLVLSPASAAADLPPHELKLAFLADQGIGADAVAVLELVAAEGAHAVVHQGDFDYENDPAAWDAMITDVLGANFPYFASIGNHETRWYGSGSYQRYLRKRMERLGIPWRGDLGVQSTFTWMGIHFAMVAPGILDPGDGLYDLYLRDTFGASDAFWRVASWHKNQHLMQAGGLGDATGWGVYEESRRAGAIAATGHHHSYSRTHLLSSMQQQVVASTEDPLLLTPDDPVTPDDEGRSFAFVSGLGGRSVMDQEVYGDWFASVYTSTQGATFGALFGVFHVDGDPRLARFYFKDIAGNVVDEFTLRSRVGCGDLDDDGICDERDVCPQVPDPAQLDSDFDGFGNACDADYDGDGTVGAGDLVALTRALGSSAGEGSYAPALDADGDGAIGDAELALLQLQLGSPPGPSGLACAGSPPCSACDGPDGDGDGVCDALDNCVVAPNPRQIDSDLDGYGNACDADYTNDGVVGSQDYLVFGKGFGTRAGDPGFAPALDANGDGAIGAADLLLVGKYFLGGPGPSGLACAGSIPCLGP